MRLRLMRLRLPFALLLCLALQAHADRDLGDGVYISENNFIEQVFIPFGRLEGGSEHFGLKMKRKLEAPGVRGAAYSPIFSPPADSGSYYLWVEARFNPDFPESIQQALANGGPVDIVYQTGPFSESSQARKIPYFAVTNCKLLAVVLKPGEGRAGAGAPRGGQESSRRQ